MNPNTPWIVTIIKGPEFSVDVALKESFYSFAITAQSDIYNLNLVSLRGPEGPKGDKGDPGTGVTDGVNTGDLIRWNAITEQWEAQAEPVEFLGIKLTPQVVALIEEEGVMFYSSVEKSVIVCTDN